MAVVTSFPPIARRDASVLILGSMPGKVSLEAGRYYAHPRNAFWPIMGELFGAGEGVSYSVRRRILCENHVAVWDVLQSCYRPGSLDAAIDRASEIPNDFVSFLKRSGQIRAIAFNGRTAESAFRRHVSPILATQRAEVELIALPSTSPAYAAMSWAEKLSRWRCILEYLNT